MDEILALGRKSFYKKGEILLRPSDFGGVIFCITKGMLHAYTIEKLGYKNVQILYGSGDVFPAAWILRTKPLDIYYEALTECEVIKIQEEDLRQLLGSSQTATFQMLEQISRQFVLYKARVDNLEYSFARERLAYGLLLLAKKFGKTTGEHIELPRLSQDEIGSATNVSRESVSRELRRFKRLGFISYSASAIKILNIKEIRHEITQEDSPLLIDNL